MSDTEPDSQNDSRSRNGGDIKPRSRNGGDIKRRSRNGGDIN